MSNLSTDAIVTIISTIPGLLVSSLSAWFAYVALRRRNDTHSDIETPTIGRTLVRLDAASRIAFAAAPPPLMPMTRPHSPRIPHLPQRLHPPPPPPAEETLPDLFRRPERVGHSQALQ